MDVSEKWGERGGVRRIGGGEMALLQAWGLPLMLPPAAGYIVTQLRSFLLCVALHRVPCGHPVLAVVTPVSRARRGARGVLGDRGDRGGRGDESDMSDESDGAVVGRLIEWRKYVGNRKLKILGKSC